MRKSNINKLGTRIGLAVLLASAVLMIGACSVQEKHEGDTKKVAVSTPFGDIKVNDRADSRDTGLPVYPGAREKKGDSDNEHKSADVNMSFGKFALKVVVASYVSDDSPEKILAFYRPELGKYGKVLECKGGSVNYTYHKSESKDKELHCDSKGDSDTTELKVGHEDLQRIVAVKPVGKGSEFALVYVKTSGTDKEEPI